MCQPGHIITFEPKKFHEHLMPLTKVNVGVFEIKFSNNVSCVTKVVYIKNVIFF